MPHAPFAFTITTFSPLARRYFCSCVFRTLALLQVSRSVRSFFRLGQVLEVGVNGQDYWFAEIVMASGPFLGLRYVDDTFRHRTLDSEQDDDDDLSCHVWLDAFNANVKPLGWCCRHNKRLSPPAGTQTLRQTPAGTQTLRQTGFYVHVDIVMTVFDIKGSLFSFCRCVGTLRPATEDRQSRVPH